MDNIIRIKNARTHNLKNVSLEIPKNKLVVITGVSGSGKSSLAFDTIYAEGQRRYLESLSPYARQFLELMDKPDVDRIDGLSPAIAIEQRKASKNPRSTVGTVTEIYDYLRLLYARAGTPHCPSCNNPIASQTISQMVDRILKLPAGEKVTLMAPIATQKKGTFAHELADLSKKGFVRARIDKKIFDLDSPPALNKNQKHDIDIIVDRLEASKSNRERLADSLETAVSASDGLVKVERSAADIKASEREFLLSTRQSCPACNISLPDLTPQLFSFNSPKGACTKCEGLGSLPFFDPDLIVPNKHLPLREGALAPWQKRPPTDTIPLFIALGKKLKFDINTPFMNLAPEVQGTIFNGLDDDIEVKPMSGGKPFRIKFRGVINELADKYAIATDDAEIYELSKYMNERPCHKCGGTRLKKEALAVKVGGLNISELVSLPVERELKFFKDLTLSAKQQQIAAKVVKEILERLSFLEAVGLSYLTLDRASATLAGGEDQRIRLATQLGTALTGVLYVLDEPSIGLHPKDNTKLLKTLMKLRDLGNTVIVVEHDRDTINCADHVIDLGPGAGTNGGEIISQGSPAFISKDEKSLTGKYLSNRLAISAPRKRRIPEDKWLTVVGASAHNLKDITVRFPVGVFTCITGTSGSGKSSLVHDTLYRGLMQRLHKSNVAAGPCRDIIGFEAFDKVINIDQSPIGRTPRSNPATYTGALAPIRELFSELPASKARGYKPGRFSFNMEGGRCEACCGEGSIRVEMQFLPDVFVTCEVCGGKRYNRETLEITYKGLSIADVLAMTINRAHTFFTAVPEIKHHLETMMKVGLGYLELGQSATTLSGGEAQRIKLSRELARRDTGKTLYILDEPTTGLHFHDTKMLIDVLQYLVDRKNTVLVIEHNLDLIKCADYVVDMGPEGGERGGEVIATGSPEEIAMNANSATGQYLRSL